MSLAEMCTLVDPFVPVQILSEKTEAGATAYNEHTDFWGWLLVLVPSC